MQNFYKHLIILYNSSQALIVEIVIAYIMQQEIKTTNDTHAPQSYKSFIFYFEMNKTFSNVSKNGRTIIKKYF